MSDIDAFVQGGSLMVFCRVWHNTVVHEDLYGLQQVPPLRPDEVLIGGIVHQNLYDILVL